VFTPSTLLLLVKMIGWLAVPTATGSRRAAARAVFSVRRRWTTGGGASGATQVSPAAPLFFLLGLEFGLSFVFSSIQDRVLLFSFDSSTNPPFPISIYITRSALVPMLDTLEHLGCRSNGKTHFLWKKPSPVPPAVAPPLRGDEVAA